MCQCAGCTEERAWQHKDFNEMYSLRVWRDRQEKRDG